jgi:branched-chain amino acid transport system permease protein
MAILPQIVISGLAQGALYALAALGIVVIYNASQVVNFAHGAFAALIAYLTWTLLTLAGLPFAVAIAGAIGAAFAIGWLVEAVAMRRVVDASPLTQMVVTLGLLMFFTGMTGLVWGYDPHALPALVALPSVQAGPVFVLPTDLLDLAILVALVAGLTLLFQYTRIGIAMRALTQDLFAARLAGIPIARVLSVTWGIGIVLAGIAGILTVPVTTLTPAMMETLVIYGFVAAVVGGFGTLAGAVTGGLVLGVVDDLIKTYLSPQLSLTVVFVLLLVMLYLRPNGFFGREATRRV